MRWTTHITALALWLSLVFIPVGLAAHAHGCSHGGADVCHLCVVAQALMQTDVELVRDVETLVVIGEVNLSHQWPQSQIECVLPASRGPPSDLL